MTRHDDGTCVASAKRVLGAVKPQPVLLKRRTMAAVAVSFQHRLDVTHEIDGGGGRGKSEENSYHVTYSIREEGLDTSA